MMTLFCITLEQINNMKKAYLLIILFVLGLTPAKAESAKEIKTEASAVTLYLEGAQVTRKTEIRLPSGRSRLKFINLSPYIDQKSLQLQIQGEATVLSVNFQTSTAEAIKKLSEAKERELDKLINEIEAQRIELSVVREEMGFLNENKKIGGTASGFTLATLRETALYYRTQMSTLKTKESQLAKQIETLENKKRLLVEGEDAGAKQPDSKGEIVVEIETLRAHTATANLSYFVDQASWFPTYDIRAQNTEQPIQLVYKANIHQNTKEDWDNVKLTVSSANPTSGSTLPELKTYLLDYSLAPPRYSTLPFNEVKGVVTVETGEPAIGAIVKIPNSTIATMTNANGEFSLPITDSSTQLEFSYIGCETKYVQANQPTLHITLKDAHTLLNENLTMGYSLNRNSAKRAPTGVVMGTPQIEDLSAGKPARVVESQLAVEFKINKSYTIPSSNRSIAIEVERYSLPAKYEYYAIPKITKEAFLLASISQWEEYNLLAGEANIFFDNSFVGKTILDTRNLSDTLTLSLGKDPSIIVNRELVKDKTSKRTFSSKREENRNWKLTVRNTKSSPIHFTLLDQVPISRNNTIEVKVNNLSGGAYNEQSGEVKWMLHLPSAEQKELNLHYQVRYPNNQKLLVE